MKNVKKLSKHQLDHLRALIPGERVSYPGLNIGTLNSLQQRGLVSAKYGLGSIFSPHTSIKWRLTPDGSRYITTCGRAVKAGDHQKSEQRHEP